MKKTRLICIMLTAVFLAVGVASCSRDDDNVPAAAASNNNQGGNNDGAIDDWVDLGLPSGLLWATHNVGATNPEDYGDYFAWGETTTKSMYYYSTYAYCNGGYKKLTKYCNDSDYGYNGFTDDLTTLEASDDAATTNWGNGARTPTKEEWWELINNCSGVWSSQDGVDGYRFTGLNGNTLFLPAADVRWGDVSDRPDGGGAYWSSSFHMGVPCQAWNFTFDSGVDGMSSSARASGFSVRPVRSSH